MNPIMANHSFYQAWQQYQTQRLARSGMVGREVVAPSSGPNLRAWVLLKTGEGLIALGQKLQ